MNDMGNHCYIVGTKYEGDLKNGKRDGKGALYYNDGNKYIGEFKDNKINGRGTVYFASGNKYVGEWKNDQRDGTGTFYFTDGSKYEGEFKDSEHNGKGAHYYADGSRYEGEFKDGKRYGKGTYFNTDGSMLYKGEFKDDKINGKGSLYYANGTKYEGDLKDGKLDGTGTYFKSDGSIRYKGEFKDDEITGIGNFYYDNNSIYQGELKNSKCDGNGTFYYNNSDKYVGEFKNDKRDGNGTFYYYEGDKYVGEFKNDELNGKGTFYYYHGDKYVGELKNGEMNGKGTYFNVDGSIRHKGEWKNNNLVINNPCNSEIKNTTVNSNEYIPEVIFTNIIGGSVENRQLALQNLKLGELVNLIREPNNIYDKDAIAIYNKTFEMLGYIPKDNEKDLAKDMDNGIKYECLIISKSGGNGLNYGANIQVKKVNMDSHTNNNCNEEITGTLNIIEAQFTCLNGEWEDTYQLLKNENKSRPKVLSMLGLSCFFTARFEEAYKVYYKLFTGESIYTNELGCSLNEYDIFGKELYEILKDINIHGANLPDNLNKNYKQSIERSNEQYSELDEFRVVAQSEETKFKDFLNNLEIDMESNDAEKKGWACFNAAELFFGQSKYDVAFSYYINAISSVPSKALYYGYATQALMRIENREYDMPLYSRRALDLEPENARWHMLHGIVCYRLGKTYNKLFFKTAVMELERALKCCRKDQISLRNSIEVLMKNWSVLN